jgi:hypothetical protein
MGRRGLLEGKSGANCRILRFLDSSLQILHYFPAATITTTATTIITIISFLTHPSSFSFDQTSSCLPALSLCRSSSLRDAVALVKMRRWMDGVGGSVATDKAWSPIIGESPTQAHSATTQLTWRVKIIIIITIYCLCFAVMQDQEGMLVTVTYMHR